MTSSQIPAAAGDDSAAAQPPQDQLHAAQLSAELRPARGWHVVAALAAIAAACRAAYSNSFAGPFLFDDITWIASNRAIRELWPIGPVLFPPETVATQGRPVLNLTLAINYSLGGTDVRGYHAVNLAIHILAAWTLFGVVRRTLLLPTMRDDLRRSAIWLALGIALLWALHPIQTAAVTYITQRNESLVGLFYLLTLYGTIRGATASGPGRATLWNIAAVVACLVGMVTKEVMVTAPLVVLLYDRTFLSGSFAGAIRSRWPLYVALISTTAGLVWCLASSGFHGDTAGFASKRFTAWSYLLTEPGVIAHYLGQSLWPNDLCLDYSWPAATSFDQVWPAGLFVVSLLALTVWALVKYPAVGFLGAWFFLILSPTSSFVPIDDAAFDHRMYLPLAAVATLVVLGLYSLIRFMTIRTLPTSTSRQTVATAITSGVAIAFSIVPGCCTFYRNSLFQSVETIWRDTVEKRPLNARAWDFLGEALARSGHDDEAVEYYRRSMAADPNYILPLNNLGSLFSRRNQFIEAESLYRKALEIDPNRQTRADQKGRDWVSINLASVLARQRRLDEAAGVCQGVLDRKPEFPEAHLVMADIRSRQGRPKDAIRLYERAVQLDPDLIDGHARLASLLEAQGRGPEAIVHLRRVVELSSTNAEAVVMLAVGLATEDRNDEAIVELKRALEVEPRNSSLRLHYGIMLFREKKWREAIAEWRTALEIQPNSAAATRLAWLLATCPDASVRNGKEALELAEKAMQQSSPNDPAMLDTLAAAHAELGQFDQAAALAEKAMTLATQQNQHSLATQIADRLSLYLTRKPYRDSPAGEPKSTAPPAP